MLIDYAQRKIERFKFQLLKTLKKLSGKELNQDFVRHCDDIIEMLNTSINGGQELSKMFPRVSKNTLRANASSDTLFILGSGSSINELQPREWEQIQNHTSFGVNFFLAHDFRPDLYFFETGWNEKLTQLFYEWRVHKNQEDIPLMLNGRIIKDRVWYELPMFKNSFLHFPYSIPSNNPTFVRSVLQNKFLRPKDSFLSSLHHGASISFLVDMGRIMGFKEIVLVGVDLDGPYFQQELNDPFTQKLKNEYKAISDTSTHATSMENSQSKYLKIQEILAIMMETTLKESGVRLYQLRKSSLLPFIPLYRTHD